MLADSSVLCKSYAGALATAPIDSPALAQLRMYSEKGIRHVFMVRDGRTAESQRHEAVQVGDRAERELFFARDSSVNKTQQLPATTWEGNSYASRALANPTEPF